MRKADQFLVKTKREDKMKKKKIALWVTLMTMFVLSVAWGEESNAERSYGQTVYVPAIHNCFNYNSEGCWQQGGTRLIIRNIDLKSKVKLVAIKLFGPDGNLVHDYLTAGPLELSPLASLTFTLPPELPLWDANDDGRPSFLVRWLAHGERGNPPIIESGRAILYKSQSGSWIFGAMDMTAGTVIKNH